MADDTNSSTKDWDFIYEPDGTMSIEDAVFQALGGASACWTNLVSAGIFESDHARHIGLKLIEVIEQHIEEARQNAHEQSRMADGE